MAFMPSAKTEDEVRSMTMANLKKAYNSLAEVYNKILNRKLIYCHKCNEHLSADTFYSDDNYASGKFPICKKCLMSMVEQRQKKNDEPNETKESVQRVLQMMDLPYDNDFYESCVRGAGDKETGMKEKNRKSPFSTYITCMKSLPNWKGKTWKDSDFGSEYKQQTDEDIKISQKKLKAAKKRFGNIYSNEDLIFLEDEYQDWITRYECPNKTNEKVFERLACKQLEINKAMQSGQNTKDLDKTYQDWLSSANLLPRQNAGNAVSDSLTFGQLIEKWESEDPVPPVDEELADVDNIGTMLKIFFSSHLARVLGLDGGYSKEYDEYMEQYTVHKPEYMGADDNGKSKIYNKLFGSESE